MPSEAKLRRQVPFPRTWSCPDLVDMDLGSRLERVGSRELMPESATPPATVMREAGALPKYHPENLAHRRWTSEPHVRQDYGNLIDHLSQFWMRSFKRFH